MGLMDLIRDLRQDRVVHGSWRNRALWAMAVYRFGRWGMEMRAGPFRWIVNKVYGTVTVFAPILTGVALDRATRVGRRFHIVHPGMVLIHPQAVFGDRCGVMHNVTVGMNTDGGVPTVGDDVFIGTGAVVLGAIHIGDGARIGANSLVLTDVPAGAMAIGVPAKIYPAAVWKKMAGMGAQSGQGAPVMNLNAFTGHGERADVACG